MKKTKNLAISLCASAVVFATVGAVTMFPSSAEASMTVSEAISEFVMEEGAAVRKSTDKQGIRFNATLSEQAYDVLSSANAEFGMLIVPKDYVTEGYELTVENVFGENAVYQANVKASEVEAGKKAIIQITEPTIADKGDEYKIYGSLVGVLTPNIPRGFIGRSYVCVDGEYYLADYANGLEENNTRSMAYVAKLAIEAGDADSATLDTTYIDPVENESYAYTINKVTIDLDGTMKKEQLSNGTAQFGTSIQEKAVDVFGYEGTAVDSFVGMENAEFNVVYNATPVSVVVENDATATERYAAEELAGYISQVTGKAVEVVSQAASAKNNIYVATDTSLGLEADSFKLSYADGNVHINGVDERGTLYGVYEYEEAYMGIKFLTENYTHVPVTNKQISAVETKTYTPSFAYRTYMNNSIGFYDDANVKYSSHLRFISQFSNERAQSDLMNKVQYTMPWMAQGWLHASHSILAYAAIGAYQAGATDILNYTVGGDGLLSYCEFNSSAASSSYKSAFDTSGSMLDVCYSNDTAKAWVKAGLKYAMDNYPEMEYFMLGQADKRTNCSCTDCWLARLKGANKSWLIANFVKEMATYTNSLGYTDKKIVMFAYQDTEVAPKAGRNAALTDMPSNVYVQWAPVDSDRYFALDTTNIEGWKTALGMTDGRFLVWSYEVDFYSYFTYYPTMQNWVTNFDTYKDLGVDLVMMQSSHNTSGIADSYLDAYVASKLLWNFKADDAANMNALVESAKAEFIEYFYGSAAKSYVETYYDNFDALYENKFASKGYTDGDWSFAESELNGLLDLLEQAISATEDETYLNHLNMLTLTPRYMLAKYCQVADSTLANNISSVSAMTAEGTTVAADVNLQGDLSFTKGHSTIYNVKYDANGRVIGMTVDIPGAEDWYFGGANPPRFTAEYMNELYAQGVQYVAIDVSSSASGAHFITMYNGEANYYADNGDQRVVVQNGGELFFSYVDVDGGQGLTKETTLELTISYLTDSQIIAKEIGLTVDNAVTVSKNADANAYTLSNTNGMFTAYFSAEQVNKWLAAGYDAISMNVSFTLSATLTKTVCMNGENFNTMKSLLTDETGNAVWTLILAENTPISIWAQNGDDVSTGAFTISNATLLTHVMGDIEYDANNHWNACTREGCNYVSNLGEHSYGSYESAIGAIDYGCATCGYIASRTEIEKPTVDFTANTYGASVYSMYLATDFPTQVSATAGALTYGLFEDGSNGGLKSTNQIVLPKINFAAVKTVTIGVLFNTFSWDQQFGLTANALTNISDGWVNWASYNGTLTFVLENGELVMTLTICNKQLTQTITDEDIINGKKSASFFAQSYFTNSTVTLSDFEFGGTVAIPDDGRFEAGYATVTDVEYDANEYITKLTVNIPHNVEWSNNSPVLTQSYLNTLYAAGIRKITFSVTSTATTNNFIVVYNGAADYNATASTFEIVENAGDLKFSYVNLNNGGYTVETTLTITLSYQIDPQIIADEIGMTLYSGVNMTKDAEGVYTLSNMNGYQKGAAFSAEQVNAWIAEGYSSISMRVSFTANANIDTAVAYSASASWVTDSTGNVVWTFNLNTDEAIDFWAQKSGAVSSGAFTLSEIKLNLSPAAIAKEIGMTLASGVNITKDADGVYTLSNMNGYQGGAAFSAEQVNAWIAKGYISISMRVSFTANSAIDTVVAYSASTGFVTDSTGNVVWTFNLKADEAIDFWVQKSGQVSSGAFTLSEITLKKQPPYVAGYATVSGETYDANDYITGMTMTIPDATEWSGNAPYFTEDYLNALYAAGVESIEFTVTSTTDGYSFITFYNNALDYDPRDGYLVTLFENGGALKISYVNLNTGNTAATTLTIAITYHFSPQAIANEIGLTLRDTNLISKDAENTYTISNAVGYDASAYFSAEQVNAWLAAGYTSISMNVAFTAGETIDTVVYYTVTSSFVSDSTGSATWNITLRENEAIYLWAQKDGSGSSGAFTISNVALA